MCTNANCQIHLENSVQRPLTCLRDQWQYAYHGPDLKIGKPALKLPVQQLAGLIVVRVPHGAVVFDVDVFPSVLLPQMVIF